MIDTIRMQKKWLNKNYLPFQWSYCHAAIFEKVVYHKEKEKKTEQVKKREARGTASKRLFLILHLKKNVK